MESLEDRCITNGTKRLNIRRHNKCSSKQPHQAARGKRGDLQLHHKRTQAGTSHRTLQLHAKGACITNGTQAGPGTTCTPRWPAICSCITARAHKLVSLQHLHRGCASKRHTPARRPCSLLQERRCITTCTQAAGAA